MSGRWWTYVSTQGYGRDHWREPVKTMGWKRPLCGFRGTAGAWTRAVGTDNRCRMCAKVLTQINAIAEDAR